MTLSLTLLVYPVVYLMDQSSVQSFFDYILMTFIFVQHFLTFTFLLMVLISFVDTKT